MIRKIDLKFVDPDEIILITIRKADNSCLAIVRLYDFGGEKGGDIDVSFTADCPKGKVLTFPDGIRTELATDISSTVGVHIERKAM